MVALLVAAFTSACSFLFVLVVDLKCVLMWFRKLLALLSALPEQAKLRHLLLSSLMC